MCACVCFPAVWGSSSCQLTSCIWRSKAARAVKNGAQHGQSMWACSVYYAPFPHPLPASLCGVCIYLLVNKTAVYIHSTAQRSPKLKLSRNEAEKEEERGGKGSLASVVFTSGFFSAALSIDRRHVKCDTGTQAYTDAACVQHDV